MTRGNQAGGELRPTSPGAFITVEGGEGVGKSHFVEAISRHFLERGREIVTTREPGGTPTADKIREIFARPASGDPLRMEAEALLVSAARAQHVAQLILPALREGKFVLCDRFADSTRVYQGKIGAIPRYDLERLIAFSTGGLEPDLTFLLDCDVDISLGRLAQRTSERQIEKGRSNLSEVGPAEVGRYDKAKRSFHERLRFAYHELAQEYPERIVVIDASAKPETVAAKAIAVLLERFP